MANCESDSRNTFLRNSFTPFIRIILLKASLLILLYHSYQIFSTWWLLFCNFILHSDHKFFIGLGFIGLRSRLLPGHFRTLAFLFTRKIIKNFDLWPKAPSRINVVHLLIRKCIFSVSDSSSINQGTFYCRSTKQKYSPATPFFKTVSQNDLTCRVFFCINGSFLIVTRSWWYANVFFLTANCLTKTSLDSISVVVFWRRPDA